MEQLLRKILYLAEEPLLLLVVLLVIGVLFVYLKKDIKRLKTIIFLYIVIQIISIVVYIYTTNNFDSRKYNTMTELIVHDKEFPGGYFTHGKLLSIFSLEFLYDKEIYIKDKDRLKKEYLKYVDLKYFYQDKTMLDNITNDKYNYLKEKYNFIENQGYIFNSDFSLYKKTNQCYIVFYSDKPMILTYKQYQEIRDAK
jgi:hypothetical protein